MNSMISKTTNPAAVACGPDGMALLGRTIHDLRGIRFEDAGGSGAGAGGAGGAGAGAGAGGAGAGGGDQGGAGGAGGAGAGGAGDDGKGGDKGGQPNPLEAPVGGVPFADLPAETQKEVRSLRRAEQTLKAEKTALENAAKEGLTPEQRKNLGKLLGYEKDETPDSAELTTRAAEAAATAQAAQRENMVLRVAPGAHANADLLLDSKGFAKTIEGLDPADRTGIEQAIKDWVAANPSYSATPVVAGSSGGQQQQGEQRSTTKKSLSDSVAAGLAGQQPKKP